MPARPAAISPTFFSFLFLKKKKKHISVKYGASSRPHDSRQQLPVLQRLMDWGAIWNIGLYWGVRGCQAYRHFLCGCVCLSVYPCLGLPFLSPSDSNTFLCVWLPVWLNFVSTVLQSLSLSLCLHGTDEVCISPLGGTEGRGNWSQQLRDLQPTRLVPGAQPKYVHTPYSIQPHSPPTPSSPLF